MEGGWSKYFHYGSYVAQSSGNLCYVDTMFTQSELEYLYFWN